VSKIHQLTDDSNRQLAGPRKATMEPMRRQPKLIAGLVVWFLSWSAFCLDGRAAPPEITGLRVGVNGAYKLGLWTPIWIQLRSGATGAVGQLRVTLPDDEGGPYSLCSDPITLAGNEAREIEMLVQIGRPRATVTVCWKSEDGSTVEKVFQVGREQFAPPVTARTPVFVWLGPSQPPQTLLARRNEKGQWAWINSPERLPTHFLGYQCVRCVVVAIGDDEKFTQALSRAEKQMMALREWVHNGGKVVVSLGPGGKALLSENGSLAWTAPGTWQNVIALRKFAGIESYVDSPRPIVMRRSDAPLQAHQFGNLDGVVTAKEGNIPLVVRRQLGFGTVVFFTPDLTHRALIEWNQWDRLIDRLVGYSPGRDEETINQPRTLMHYGYADLSGQLRSALDVPPVIPFVPFSWIAAFVVIYLVVVGPVDYWFLGFGLRNHRWTWFTFPIAVILAAFVSIAVGTNKGTKPITREVQWLDYDLANSKVRGLAFASLYSPRPESYDVRFSLPELSTKTQAGEMRLGWFGIPGHGLGGMENVTGFSSSLEPYTCTPDAAAMNGIPVNQWSTRSFWTIWMATNQTSPLLTDVFDRESVLRGRIQNNLNVTLESCFVTYGDWAYELGTLKPGEAWESILGDDRRELRSWLNGRQVFVEGEGVRAQTRQRVQPYDPGSRDLGYILRMMAFYEAAGGVGYVELSHEYWPFLDGSEWLTNGQAVMIARVKMDSHIPPSFGFRPKAATTESLTASSPEIFCRFVIPVLRKPRSLDQSRQEHDLATSSYWTENQTTRSLQ